MKERIRDWLQVRIVWMKGDLEPGEYRIGKEVMDFVETGANDKYMVYVHFIIN